MKFLNRRPGPGPTQPRAASRGNSSAIVGGGSFPRHGQFRGVERLENAQKSLGQRGYQPPRRQNGSVTTAAALQHADARAWGGLGWARGRVLVSAQANAPQEAPAQQTPNPTAGSSAVAPWHAAQERQVGVTCENRHNVTMKGKTHRFFSIDVGKALNSMTRFHDRDMQQTRDSRRLPQPAAGTRGNLTFHTNRIANDGAFSFRSGRDGDVHSHHVDWASHGRC